MAAEDEDFEPTELALEGDVIFERHVATRASNKRQIIVEALGDVTYEGYSIGLDDESLQVLDLPSGIVATIKRRHIVAFEDGKPFRALTPAEKDMVDKRTSSFRKISQTWLQENWPDVYDRRDDDAWDSRQRFSRKNSRDFGSRDGRAQSSPVYPADVQDQVRLPAGDGSSRSDGF